MDSKQGPSIRQPSTSSSLGVRVGRADGAFAPPLFGSSYSFRCYKAIVKPPVYRFCPFVPYVAPPFANETDAPHNDDDQASRTLNLFLIEIV